MAVKADTAGMTRAQETAGILAGTVFGSAIIHWPDEPWHRHFAADVESWPAGLLDFLFGAGHCGYAIIDANNWRAVVAAVRARYGQGPAKAPWLWDDHEWNEGWRMNVEKGEK